VEPQKNADVETKKYKKKTFAFLIKLVVVCLAFWVVFTYVFGLYQMSGQYMYPRIMDGDLVLYYRLGNSYVIGDVITCQVDGHRKTGRVVAMGGDVVTLSESGQLLVNGNVQEEEVFYATEEIPGGISYPYTVDEDSYFILCDFRTASTDSRYYGAVAKKDIDGQVVTILRRRGI
jgi:signal peptidase I